MGLFYPPWIGKVSILSVLEYLLLITYCLTQADDGYFPTSF